MNTITRQPAITTFIASAVLFLVVFFVSTKSPEMAANVLPFIVIAFVFALLAAALSFAIGLVVKSKPAVITLSISCVSTFAFALFKLQHWPGQLGMMISGVVLLLVALYFLIDAGMRPAKR